MHTMNGHPIWCPPARTRGDGPQAREITTEHGLDYKAIRALVQRAKARGLITERDTPDEEPPNLPPLPPRIFENACYLCRKTYKEQREKPQIGRAHV